MALYFIFVGAGLLLLGSTLGVIKHVMRSYTSGNKWIAGSLTIAWCGFLLLVGSLIALKL